MKTAKGFPVYVRLGLLGINSRRAALVQFWTAIAVSVILLLALPGISHSFVWTMVFCGTVLLTAKWYWSAIRWVDAHGGWDKATPPAGGESANPASRPAGE